MKIAQIHRIFARYMDGWLPIEPDVNAWLKENNITGERLIKVTFHYEQVATEYPAPNNFRTSNYAVIYYSI